jgi:endonuclease-8
MPEGDTVWLTAKRLDAALAGTAGTAGSVVTTFDLRVPQLATVDLRGQTITEVVAIGKHILMRFDGDSGRLTLHSHLRMDGSWRLTSADQQRNQRPDQPFGTRSRAGVPRGSEHQIRAIVGTETWTALGLRVHDLALVATGDEHQLVGHLGPDLLSPHWDSSAALDRLRAQPNRAIGDALLDQRNLAGIGNLYKAETLFIRAVNPWTQVGQVSGLEGLVDTARRLLYRNREHPEQSTTGLLGRGEQHWVYLRSGEACRRCGALIRHARQGVPPQDREVWWCPTCQPELSTPTDP